MREQLQDAMTLLGLVIRRHTAPRQAPPAHARDRRRGGALFLSIVLITLLVSTSLFLVQLSHTNVARASANREGGELLNAARAGLAQAQLDTWGAYLLARGGTAGNTADFRGWLAGAPLNLAAGQTLTLPDMAASPSAGGVMGSVRVTRTVRRHDQGANDTFLVLRAVATQPGGSSQRVAEQVLRLGGQQWEGFRFALLANNVNCIFCHARMNSVERFYGIGSGPFQRVKVASLETLQLRDGSDSTIAGSLYVQHSILKKDGTPITEDNLGNTTVGGAGGLQAEAMDANGKIIDPTQLVDFNFLGNNVPYANFYKQYPTDPAQQIDGPLPTKFPPIVPDLDGDRVIDQNEWDGRTGSMTGTISGGVIRSVPSGGTLSGGTLPTVGNETTYTSGDPNVADKHVVLVGTEQNPIVIDGEVAIDGDVVLSGYVKANGGTLVARGNLYIVGDVKYVDGTDQSGKRTFGVSPDGTSNALALGAGGNILHNAYNEDKAGTPLTDASTKGFTVEETGLFNRMEWTKTQQYQAADGKLTNDPALAKKDASNNPLPNSAYVAGHVPRYYVMDGASSPKMLLETDHVWNDQYKVWDGPEKGTPNVTLTGGVKSQLNPENNWISQADLHLIYAATDAARPAATPYEVDALLYTDNAIMMMARKDSSAQGQVIVNGAIISADAGILVPGNTGSGKPAEWKESSKRDGTTTMSEAEWGVDFNNDGDITDTVTLKNIWDNRAAWGWTSKITDEGGGKYKLNMNKDNDFSDTIKAIPPPNPALDGGLFLNFDVKTSGLLNITDPTTLNAYTVSRRER